MANQGEDLDLLLSLRDERVLETPPASPSSRPPPDLGGYNSDDGSPRGSRPPDMSVFRDAVKDYLDANKETAKAIPPKSNKSRRSDDIEVEKFSGLRVRNPLIGSVELANRLSDIRFIRLPTIRNLLMGDALSGCWATVGVLTENGAPKLSSAGKSYCIWKIGCFSETDVSVFLFGDAYTTNCKERVGAVFALFNASVRKDTVGKGFSLSVYSASQMLKIGISADYGICKGKRKDGLACTMVINKCKGTYCKFHTSKASQQYTTKRTELSGGNLHTAFKLQREGICTVNPLAEASDKRKPLQSVKVMSLDGLRKALSKADKVTSNSHSQGIRFLTQVTARKESKVSSKASLLHHEAKFGSDKRSSLPKENISKVGIQNEPQAKRKKLDHVPQNMIELEIASSDEEI
ncbi:hypothetical protein Cni_G01631 [Canna indica]|uniref:Zinc finger Mcm10/DnaG-type domain-containing protein n=1 Tax=Canna indica TaxID=4628 RepID=A0AAQ3JPV4_9LILI|nr:hypothetical protein Cni_G01631 [Canna indica]